MSKGRLKIDASPDRLPLPQRVYRLYETLLSRDEAGMGIEPHPTATFAARHRLLVKTICKRLVDLLALDMPPNEPAELLRLARRRLREAKADPAAPGIKSAAERLTLNLRLGAFAFAGDTVTQEELAEHIKRIRNDHCKGTMRDTLNCFVPRPVGPRTAIIRVPEPVAMHEFDGSVDEALALTRQRMQDALDRINEELRTGCVSRTYPNPFYRC